jgi:hypothetical protein
LRGDFAGNRQSGYLAIMACGAVSRRGESPRANPHFGATAFFTNK